MYTDWKLASEIDEMRRKQKHTDKLTVTELIDLLRCMPQEAFVETEGCDCIGQASGVEYDSSDNTVLIRR